MTSWFWTSSGISHVGRERSLNEDAYLEAPRRRLWAVADGMGGHDRGDVASRCVIEALADLDVAEDFDVCVQRVRAALERANERLLVLGRDSPGGQAGIIGSTVVVLFESAHRAGIMWAGDSRAYRLRDGRLERITTDHSRVQDLIDRGKITTEEAESHPQANVITRAVGVTQPLRLDVESRELANDDCFLLCSDGLSRYVGDNRLAAALSAPLTASGCKDLIDAALAANARDNVTAVVARCREDTQSDTVFNPDAPKAGVATDDATLMAEPDKRER